MPGHNASPADVAGLPFDPLHELIDSAPVEPQPVSPALYDRLWREAHEWQREHRARVARGEVLSAEASEAVAQIVCRLKTRRCLLADDAARLRIAAGPVQLGPTRIHYIQQED